MSIGGVNERQSVATWRASSIVLIACLVLSALVLNSVTRFGHQYGSHRAPAAYHPDRPVTASDEAQACAFCAAAAVLEPFMPPPSPVLVAPRVHQAAAAIVVLAVGQRYSRAHSWRSRAPPAATPT